MSFPDEPHNIKASILSCRQTTAKLVLSNAGKEDAKAKMLVADQRRDIATRLLEHEQLRSIHLPFVPSPTPSGTSPPKEGEPPNTTTSTSVMLSVPKQSDGVGIPGSVDLPEAATVILPSSFSPEEQTRHEMASLVQHERALREDDALRILELLRVAVKRYAHGVQQKVSNKVAVGQWAHTRMRTRVAKFSADVNVYAEKYRRVRSALLSLGMDNGDVVFQELREQDLGVGAALWGKHFLGGGKSKLSWIWRVPQQGGAEADWLKEGELNLTGTRSKALIASVADKVLWFQCRAQVKRWGEEVQIIVEELRRCVKFFGAYEIAWGKLIMEGENTRGRDAFCQKKVNTYRRLKVESEQYLKNHDHAYWQQRRLALTHLNIY